MFACSTYIFGFYARFTPAIGPYHCQAAAAVWAKRRADMRSMHAASFCEAATTMSNTAATVRAACPVHQLLTAVQFIAGAVLGQNICGGLAPLLFSLPLRYDTRRYFNVRSKADTSRLNLLHGNRQLKSEKQEN